MKLWEYIKENMMKNPTQQVCEGTATMSYEEVIVFAELLAKKIRNEKCCAIWCSSEMMTAMSILSCFAAEVTAVPLSARYGIQHCNKILETISPTAVITDMNGMLQVIRLQDAAYTPPKVHPALIMCTSGTTGKPKGAMLTEQNLLTNISDIVDYFNIDCHDSMLIARPLYHCAVLTGEFLIGLVKGVKIVFYSEAFNPKQLSDLILEYSITVMGGTPTLIGMIARFHNQKANAHLKTICISGECMGKETGRRIADAFPGASIYHVYGLTEAGPRVCYLPPELFRSHPDSVGFPLKSVELRIMKTNGTVAGKNEEGTLWIRGANIMTGYYNAPEQTKKVLWNEWLCTGDIAVMDNDGLLKIKGRTDNLIIRAGMNIYPQEIESVLKTDARVQDVLVYAVKDDRMGTQIGLKISGDLTSVEEVRKLCVSVLPSYQVPTVIQLLKELPKNGSGKIIRR